MTDTTDRQPDDSPFADWPRPLAFVLSGGGAFGSVQVGMMRALLERGTLPDLVVGASVGSLNGVVLAATPDTAVDSLTELWRAMSRRTIFGSRLGAIRNLTKHRALGRFDRIEALIDEHVAAESFDQLTVRFAAVATDALSGEPELLSHGQLKPALLASSAVPGVFPPVGIGGREYIDGGVAANVPIRQAIAFGAASIITLDATPPTFTTRVPRSVVGGLINAAAFMLRNQRAHAVDELVHRYPVAVIPSAVPPDFGTFNFDHTESLLLQSYQRTVAVLDGWEADAAAISHER